jgi:plasmid stabilization system protein ParE
MKVATGTIVEGKVVIEGNAFPEGTVVAVIARGEEAMVTLPAWLQAELDAAQWWQENRPLAPGAIRLDLESALALLIEEPGLGSRVHTTKPYIVRRIHLPRIGYFAYYRVRLDRLELLRFWHERRGQTPPV